MAKRRRRSSDTLKRVDDLLRAHTQDETIDGRPLANLAAAMAIEYSGADRGALLEDRGNGLEPVLALESDLSRSTNELSSYDQELIERARSSRRIEHRRGRVASPVVLDRVVTCMLYLERDQGRLDSDAVDLAEGVASRIGALLRSASLVEKLARRSRSVSTLEAVGACMSAGELRREHLENAIDGALAATHSGGALLFLVDPPNSSQQSIGRGDGHGDLEARTAAWMERVRAGDLADADTAIDGPCLVEPLLAELVARSGEAVGALGLLAVRRQAGASDYDQDDRNVFRAIAHLVSGALARMEYFSRAAEDPLTATGSRLALQLGLAQAHAQSAATGLSFSLLLLDIDNFKAVNDRWGHLVGDEVLRELAARTRSRLRSSDSVARYGGDEFVLILTQTAAQEAVALGAELCRLISARPFTEHGLEITVSAGAATSTPASTDLDALLSAADKALYGSKSQGRNRVTHFADLGEES